GDGAILAWLMDLGFSDSHGVDVSREEVEAAQNLGLPVQQGDMKDFLRASKDPFDLIILRNVLEHNTKEEILELLDLVRSALADGGRVFIQVPNGESPFGSRIR